MTRSVVKLGGAVAAYAAEHVLDLVEDGCGRLGGDRAADLHHDAAHERYSALIRTYSYERSLVR